MDKLNELTYIPLLGVRNLKRTPSGYKCSCPICMEGKHPNRTRCYILTNKHDWITVYCQNCNYNSNLKNFIKLINQPLYEQYVEADKREFLNDLNAGTILKRAKTNKPTIIESNIRYTFNLNRKYFVSAKTSQQCIDFCKRRKILDFIDDLWYCIHPTKIYGNMIIFPFSIEDKLYGFQGRRVNQKLFYTHSKNEGMKIYNYFDVDREKRVCAFESIIDSMMVPNSIAMLGTTLNQTTLNKFNSLVFITDNDKTGINRAVEYVKNGHKVFVYPDNFKYKDFNDAVVKGGYKQNTLIDMIDNNTFEGLAGVTRLSFKQNKMR